MKLEDGLKTTHWCYTCEAFRGATWAVGIVPVEDATPVPDVLRATCDVCGTVIALAPEATTRIHEAATQRGQKFRTTIRMQQALVDAVSAELSRAGADPQDFDVLLRGFGLYLLTSNRNWKSAVRLLKAVSDEPLLQRPVDATITLRLPSRMWNLLEELEDDTGVHSTSELVRRILIVVSKDWKQAVGTQHKRPPYIAAIRNLAMVS